MNASEELEKKINRMVRNVVSLMDHGDMFEEISFMAIVFNNNSSIIAKANQNFCKYLGYEEKELVGRPFTDFIPKDEMVKSIKANNEFKEGIKKTTIFKNHWLSKSGELKSMYWVREKADNTVLEDYSFGFAFSELTIS